MLCKFTSLSSPQQTISQQNVFFFGRFSFCLIILLKDVRTESLLFLDLCILYHVTAELFYPIFLLSMKSSFRMYGFCQALTRAIHFLQLKSPLFYAPSLSDILYIVLFLSFSGHDPFSYS